MARTDTTEGHALWVDTWCNGYHACFPCLPPMLLCAFDSPLGLAFSGFSMASSEACRQGFSSGAPVSSPPSSVNCSANKTTLR